MKFSERHNIKSPKVAIVTRDEAPENFRNWIIQSAYHYGLKPSDLRTIICRILRVGPDPDNWSERPNIHSENEALLHGAEWAKAYEVAEQLYESVDKEKFESDLNDFFYKNGIGWIMEKGNIIHRNDEDYSPDIGEAIEILETADKHTAKNEIQQAVNDLSKRPTPDLTGAIQHAMAGLECLVRDITGDTKGTLGQLVKNHKGVIPAPVDSAVSQIYGYSSNIARHIQEGNDPSEEEAELVVGLMVTLVNYLSKKNFAVKEVDDKDHFPF